MSPTILSQMVVDIKNLPSNRFTESHLQAYEDMLPWWETTESHLCGENLMKGLEFKGFELIDIDTIDKEFHQLHRAAGMNKEYKNLKENISSQGFKCKYFPPVVIRDGNRNVLATGNTRFEVLKKNDVENCPVAIYNFDDDLSEIEKKAIIIRAGQKFQPQLDPAAPPSKEDIRSALSRLVETGSVDVHDDNEMMNACTDLCSSTNFRRSTIQKLTLEVQNNHGVREVRAYGSDRAAARPETILRNQYKFIDNDDVVYITYGSSMWSKAFTLALETWKENPTKQVRLMIHTETLEGFDFEKCYDDRIQKFYREFHNLLEYSALLGGGTIATAKERVVVYGAFPAIGDGHQNLNEPVLFHPKKKIAYQKNSDYTIDLI